MTEQPSPTLRDVVAAAIWPHNASAYRDAAQIVIDSLEERGYRIALADSATGPLPPISPVAVQNALDEAWLESNDAYELARPPDLAEHLWEALREYAAIEAEESATGPLDVERLTEALWSLTNQGRDPFLELIWTNVTESDAVAPGASMLSTPKETAIEIATEYARLASQSSGASDE